MNEELLDPSSSILDFIPDSSIDPEDNSIDQSGPGNVIYDGSSSVVRYETEQGSVLDDSLLDSFDSSSAITVILDQREVIEELQRIEGYNISILYTLYIGLGLFFSVVIIKFILHFTRFN